MLDSALPVMRRPGVTVLLVNSALMSAGFFMLIPLVSVYGTQALGLSAAAVGSILATRVFLQQGLTIVWGGVADGVGYKPILVTGIAVRTVGFAMFAFVHDYWGLMGAALVAALGGAMFESTHKAALAALVPPRERPVAFSLSSTAGRIGTMLGPPIGVALLPIGFATLSLAAAGCFAVACVSILAFMPAVGAPAAATVARVNPWAAAVRRLPEMFGAVWADKTFVGFTFLTTGYWFIFSQIFLTLPLYVTQISGSEQPVGILLAANSAFALLMQFPVVAWANRRLSPLPIIIRGCGIMAAGLSGMALGALVPPSWGTAGLVAVMLGPIFLYALGDLLIQPTLQAVTGDLARPDALGSYFGFASFGLAVGGGLGNALGGVLFDQAMSIGMPAAPWFCYSALAVGLAVAFRWYGRRVERTRHLPVPDRLTAPDSLIPSPGGDG